MALILFKAYVFCYVWVHDVIDTLIHNNIIYF